MRENNALIDSAILLNSCAYPHVFSRHEGLSHLARSLTSPEIKEQIGFGWLFDLGLKNSLDAQIQLALHQPQNAMNFGIPDAQFSHQALFGVHKQV